MARIAIDLDDGLLAEAQCLFGTATAAATVRAALLGMVQLARRRELADAIANGEFDLLHEPGRRGA
ncbi:type II toxin-antitoxin system VapB family antitoxin [Kitasatospora sp. NPDC002227]|uniref:type II toxin-antitoxin system VapB family antitoxin n=1 Tax=Kitasatospora sp. NPDC002227 TaxID=3154773 RepID=UPI003323CA19